MYPALFYLYPPSFNHAKILSFRLKCNIEMFWSLTSYPIFKAQILTLRLQYQCRCLLLKLCLHKASISKFVFNGIHFWILTLRDRHRWPTECFHDHHSFDNWFLFRFPEEAVEINLWQSRLNKWGNDLFWVKLYVSTILGVVFQQKRYSFALFVCIVSCCEIWISNYG